MIPRSQLQPGSSEPQSPAEIDELLTAVPELAFLPEFEGCIPALDGVDPSHEHADRVSDVRGITAALHALSQAAAAQGNGGLSFLVRTLLHFIEVKAVPPSQHPLIVALYLRGSAQPSGDAQTPASVAAAMDSWR